MALFGSTSLIRRLQRLGFSADDAALIASGVAPGGGGGASALSFGTTLIGYSSVSASTNASGIAELDILPSGWTLDSDYGARTNLAGGLYRVKAGMELMPSVAKGTYWLSVLYGNAGIEQRELDGGGQPFDSAGGWSSPRLNVEGIIYIEPAGYLALSLAVDHTIGADIAFQNAQVELQPLLLA